MKSLLLSVISPVLTVSLIVACSNNEDIPSNISHSSEAAVQNNEEIPKPKTDVVEVEVEGEVENSTQDVAKQIMRSADSHTHGDAELAVVLENGRVTIELESPLYNILGFEHAPETDVQKESLSRAETQLGRGAKLFTFNNGAGCVITTKGQAVKLFDVAGHDEAHNDDHNDKHDDHDEQSDTHKDVLLRYEFLCQDPLALSNVSVNLFEFFEELSEIDVTYLGLSTQRQVTLNRNNSQMDISQ